MNRARLAWAAALSIVALAGAVGVGLSLANTHQAERQAQAQRDDAQAVAELLREILPGSTVPNKLTVGEDTTVLDGLRRLHFRLETGGFADRPGVDQSLRRIWGGVHTRLGEGRALNLIPYAEISLRSGLERLRAEHKGPHPTVAATMHELAAVLRIRDRLSEAESICRQALAMRLELGGEQSHEVAQTRVLLGHILADLRMWPEARENVAAAAATLLSITGEETELELATAAALQSRICFEQGLIREAAPFMLDALTRRTRQLAPDDADIVGLLTDAATIAQDNPDTPIAIAMEKAYGVRGADLVDVVAADRLLIEAPRPDIFGFASPTSDRGRTLALQRVVELQRTLVGPDDPSLVRGLLAVMNSAADENIPRIRIAAALEAAELLEHRFGRDDPRLLVCLDQAAISLLLSGRADEAVTVVRKGLGIREKVPAEVRDVLVYANAHRVLAMCLSLGRHLDEAIVESRLAVEELSRAVSSEHYLVALAKSSLAYCLVESGEIAEAEALSEDAANSVEGSGVISPDQRAHVAFARGHALTASGRFAEALPYLEVAWNNYYQYLPVAFQWRAVCLVDAARATEGIDDGEARATWLARAANPLQDVQ